MSTKIYNGYHLPKLKTIRDVIQWWRKLSEEFKPMVIKSLAKEVGDAANRAADVLALFEAGLIEIFYEDWAGKDASAIGYDTLKERGKYQHAHQLVLTIFEARGKTLCTLHSSGMAEKFFVEKSGAVPFPYWNNSDRPEDMSQRRWNRRAEIWEEALLARSGVPKLEGLGLETENPESLLWDVRLKYKNLPCGAKAKRALALAREKITAQRMREKPEECRKRLSVWNEEFLKTKSDPETKELAQKIEAILPSKRAWVNLKQAKFPEGPKTSEVK